MNIDIRELYDTNEDFRRYVDECRKYDGRSVDEELELKIVKYKALDILGKLNWGDN